MNEAVKLDRIAMDHILNDVFDAYEVAGKLLKTISNPKHKRAIKHGIIAGLDRALEHLTKEGIRAPEIWEAHKKDLSN